MQILWQNIIQAFRSLRTQAWQVAISSVGLAVGIVCLTFSVNWLWTETHYDSFRPDYEELYMAGLTDSTKRSFIQSAYTVQQIEDIRLATEDIGVEIGLYRRLNFPISLHIAGQPLNNIFFHVCGADSAFVSVLRMSALYGDVASTLARPDAIIITDSLAMCFFGRKDVVGETLVRSNRNETYTIGAVVEANKGYSHFPQECIVGLECAYNMSYWPKHLRYNNHDIVLRIPDMERFNERIGDMRYINYVESEKDSDRISYCSFLPMKRNPYLMHRMKIDWGWVIHYFFYQLGFVIISFLLVLSALTNLIMVYTSINLARVREYALRRSMGATSWQNVQWILVGVVPTLLLAVLFAGVIMEWTLVLGMDKKPEGDSTLNAIYWITVGSVILLCLLGMAFPIWRMRRAYRESFLGHGGTSASHSWLLIFQCAIASMLLFLSIGMQRQIHSELTADLGYEHKDMLRFYTGHMGYGNEAHKNHTVNFAPIAIDIVWELKNTPGIVDAVAMQSDICNPELRLFTKYFEQITTTDNGDEMRVEMPDGLLLSMSWRALEFFNICPVKGGGFTEESTVNNAHELQAVITSEFAKQLVRDGQLPYGINVDMHPQHAALLSGMENYYNTRRVLNIMGVVDLRMQHHTSNIPGIIIALPDEGVNCYPDDKYYTSIYVKHASGQREEAEAAVREVLRRFDVPENDIHLSSADEYIQSYYASDRFYANMLTVFGTVSVVITLAGIFSMLLYSLRLRRRSMAIHRVMGATFKDIFVSTIRPYLLYAVIGAVIAYFPAYLLMREWMNFFYYGEMPGVWLMLAILAAMCAIISLIVWWQVSVCMKEKPVEILKPEA